MCMVCGACVVCVFCVQSVVYSYMCVLLGSLMMVEKVKKIFDF